MKKLLLIIIPVLLVALGAGGWLVLKPAPEDPEKAKSTPGITYVLAEPFVVNLADTGRMPHFAKVGISLRLSKSSEKDVVAAAGQTPGSITDEPQVRDIIIDVLQVRTSTQLKKRAERQAMKKQMVAAVNKHTVLTILDVYFTEFAVQ